MTNVRAIFNEGVFVNRAAPTAELSVRAAIASHTEGWLLESQPRLSLKHTVTALTTTITQQQ